MVPNHGDSCARADNLACAQIRRGEIVRRTLVVGSRLALQEARFKAAPAQDCGLQILTVPRLAARLAGGFLEAITRDTLQDLVKEALNAGGFQGD